MAAEPKPPLIRGALIHGADAVLLSVALDRDEIAARLADRGYGELHRERALLAAAAIKEEATVWLRERSSASERIEVPKVGGMASSDLMTVSEAAAELPLSPSYIRRLAREGKLLGRREGRDWQLDRASVAELAADRRES